MTAAHKNLKITKIDSSKIKWLIGIDEVGRGPLAGPIGFSACVLPFHKGVKSTYKKILSFHKLDLKAAALEYVPGKDSKKMTVIQREQWHTFLNKQNNCIYVSKSAKDIDTRGLSKCIHACIAALLQRHCKNTGALPEECLVLLDGGLKAPAEFTYQQTIIKGDEKEMVISFASIFAKVTRDLHMKKLSKKYKDLAIYEFEQHKGYGTKKHREAIKQFGISHVHRRSFCKIYK